jgi:hypothetical protein
MRLLDTERCPQMKCGVDYRYSVIGDSDGWIYISSNSGQDDISGEWQPIINIGTAASDSVHSRTPVV